MTPVERDQNSAIQNSWPRFLLLVTLVALPAILRLVPHAWNFAPAGAFAIFAGAKLGSWKKATILTLLSMVVADLILGLHWTMPFVYACLLFNVWMGWQMRNRVRPLTLVGSTLLTSIVFFIVTNFGAWIELGIRYQTYPLNFAGLMQCYAAGVPFFRDTLVSDALFVTAAFGLLGLIEWRIPAMRAPKAVPAT